LHPAIQGHHHPGARRVPDHCCVESTMRTGYERGYQVYTLTDCLAATSQAEHENAIANDYPMFSRPVTSTEFAAALAGQQTLSASSRAEY
ncbi:MAG TPA: isochorismatase family protein, partial [Nakamurella sp.]